MLEMMKITNFIYTVFQYISNLHKLTLQIKHIKKLTTVFER